MTDDKISGSVQAIDRALQVLELISTNGTMSLKELYTTLGVNKASMSRVAATLCNNGYLIRNVHSGDFSLSFKTFEIGVRAVRSISYINIIKSVLEKLSSDLDVIAQFSIDDQNELLCLECFNTNNTNFSIYTNIGQRTPLYATSAGKAILSNYSNEEIRARWEKMDIKAFTPNTITSFDQFMQEIAAVRHNNYATDREESELGVFCVGTVLLDYNRRPIGAISLSSSNMDEEKEKSLSKILLDRTQRISYMLGYTTV